LNALHRSEIGRLGRQRRADVALWGIYEVSKLLVTPERLELTLAKVLHVLASFLDMRHGLIALFDRDGTPDVVVGAGWNEANSKKYKEYYDKIPERAIGTIVVTKMPVVIQSMREDPLFASYDFSGWQEKEDLSFIGVPIRDRGEVVGTLTIDRDQGGPYFRFDEEVRLLTMIANMVGQSVRLQSLISRDRERLIEEQNRLNKLLEHSGTTSDRPPPPSGIIGRSAPFQAVLEKLRIVARTNSTVLLRGESGTGKELCARALHDLSPRRGRPFVAVNCAALPESVLESELFGHEKGAFTGAAVQRKGRFELADSGTLFLDEIGDISPSFQAKLLRVLQEGELQRVGGSSTLRVDVRIVSATNRNLEEAVAKGEFRADLYYRISVVPLSLPPLRARKDDIAPLAKEFLRRFNEEHCSLLELDDGALSVLTNCNFPGNVRELENCVRRSATFAKGKRLSAADFACKHDECLSTVLWKQPVQLGTPAGHAANRSPSAPNPGSSPSSARAGASDRLASSPSTDESRTAEDKGDEKGERDRLVEAMEAAGWVQAKAARLLGLTPRQIGYALRKHDVAIRKF
jgi:Nif-specific regulatory protein